MESYDEERYLYTLYPKRPIKNINEFIPIIRVPKTLSLTKEEVLKCFEFGSVYRRFSNDGKIEKITRYDVDRVHRPNYVSPEEWKKIMGEAKDVGKLAVNGANPVEEAIKVEESAPVVEEPVKEEVVVEESVIEETPVEEVVTEEPVVEETVEEAVVEEAPAEVEETKEEEVVEEVATEETEDTTEDEVEGEFDGADEDEEEIATESEEAKPQVNINYNKKKKHHNH